MRARDFNVENASENLLRHIEYAVYRGERVEKFPTIYTINESIAKSNMSAVITAYVILGNEPRFLGQGRVHGCGLDRGHHIGYEIFRKAFPEMRYQDHYKHCWI